MSKAAKEWAKRARFKLIHALGGVCANGDCLETEYEKLTFDHIYGKDWEATGLSTDQRMLRYLKEAKQGLLQVLCHSCNSKKGDPRKQEERERARLLIEIGNYCHTDGCENRFVGDLFFDHADGPGWEKPGLDFEAKLKAYKKEIKAGRMIILCRDCRAFYDNESEPDVILFPGTLPLAKTPF